MMRSFEIDGHRALGFDTGLDARSFARAKFAQFMTEPGLIVRPTETPRNQVEFWKATGVREASGADGTPTVGTPTMVIWGPPVEGESLAALLDQAQDKALAAILAWIQALIALGEDPLALGENPPGEIPLWPSAAIVAQADQGGRPSSVFFAPPSLALRGVTADDEWYVHPDLSGLDAAAFTAAAMLYRVFTGTPPFPATDQSLLHQDMREGNFLPIRFAVPGLDTRLTALLQSVLNRTAFDRPSGAVFLNELLGILRIGGQTVSAASLVGPLAEPERLLLEKEKARHLKRKAVSVKTKRFVTRNQAILIGAFAALIAVGIIIHSMVKVHAQLPTTAGMEPVQVIKSYYNGFGEMDHQMMEACVIGGAGKDDITMVIGIFVTSRTRQAYEYNVAPLFFPAHQWQDGDSQGRHSLPDTPLFGAADLRVERLEGDENNDSLRYRVDYTFWIPERSGGEEIQNPNNIPPAVSRPYPRRDFLTLIRKKGNWRIAEIVRE